MQPRQAILGAAVLVAANCRPWQTSTLVKVATKLSKTSSHDKCDTLVGAAARKRTCFGASIASATQASTKAGSSCVTTSTPLSPLAMISLAAAQAYDTPARPLASASRTTLP